MRIRGLKLFREPGEEKMVKLKFPRLLMFSVTIVVDKLGYSLVLIAWVKRFNGDCAYVARELYIKSREIINTKFELLIYVLAYAKLLHPSSANM